MRASYWIASAFAIAVVGWIVSGQFGAPPPAPAAETGTPAASEPPLPEVRVRTLTAELMTSKIVVTGRTVASRKVGLRAETSGRIAEVPAARGALIKPDEPIAVIGMDDRSSRLSEARSLVALRQIQFDAAAKLGKKGYKAEVSVAEARANLVAANAALERILFDIQYTKIRAPFAGVVEERRVEIGDYVDVGDEVATIVDLDPILIVGSVSERDIAKLRPGMAGEALLVTGQRVSGTVSYIASVGDAATRTFRVELEASNPDMVIAEGITSELILPYAEVLAHRITPATLTLDDSGAVGIKTVTPDNVVAFHRAEIVGQSAEGAWLAGLPETIKVITVGQEFVRPGQRVIPVAQGVGTTP